MGAGEGPAYPVALHAAYKFFPDEKRAIPSAVIAQGSAVGVVIAIPILNAIITNYSWHYAFGALGLVGLSMGCCVGSPRQGRPYRRAGGRRGCRCRMPRSLSRSVAQPDEFGVVVRILRCVFRSRAGPVLVHPVPREGTWLRAVVGGQADRAAFHCRLLRRYRRQLAFAAHDASGIQQPRRSGHPLRRCHLSRWPCPACRTLRTKCDDDD